MHRSKPKKKSTASEVCLRARACAGPKQAFWIWLKAAEYVRKLQPEKIAKWCSAFFPFWKLWSVVAGMWTTAPSSLLARDVSRSCNKFCKLSMCTHPYNTHYIRTYVKHNKRLSCTIYENGKHIAHAWLLAFSSHASQMWRQIQLRNAVAAKVSKQPSRGFD